MLGRTKIILGVIIVLALAVGMLQTPLLRTTRYALWSGFTLAVGHLWGIDANQHDASNTDQLAALRTENIRLKGELQDYIHLREQLRQPAVASLRSIEAVVTGAPLDVFKTHLLLNRGALDGVVVGAPIVINGSTLIGFISEQTDRTSVGRLLFHPEVSIPAEIIETPNTRGLLTGHLHTSLMLSTIPRDTKIEVGQSVVTVASDITPAALVVGTVERVYNEENEAYQYARLRAQFDPSNVRAVQILVQP